jgi:hypothetical protein
MTRSIRPRRLLAAIIIGATAFAGAGAGAAQAGPPTPDVPSDIAVPAGNKLFLIGHAVGVQIYTCTPTGWTLAGPRADLYGDNGQLVATHFAGPSWQARDGSLVRAARDSGVTIDPSAIQWLRLKVVSATGADGDRLAETTYIQRINTTGGLAPAAATCNVATLGTTQEVPYTADYTFWKETQ